MRVCRFKSTLSQIVPRRSRRNSSFLPVESLHIDVGTQTVEQSPQSKNAAVEINVHRVGSCVSLTHQANDQLDAPLEMFHVAEIKRPFVLNRLARPLMGLCQQLNVFPVLKVHILQVRAAPEQLSQNFRSAGRALLSKANEFYFLVAVTLNAAEVDQAKSVVVHEQVIARMWIRMVHARVVHAETGEIHFCAKLIPSLLRGIRRQEII